MRIDSDFEPINLKTQNLAVGRFAHEGPFALKSFEVLGASAAPSFLPEGREGLYLATSTVNRLLAVAWYES